MPTFVRTCTTRIDSHPALTARAELESRVERKLYAALRSGRKFTGDLATSFYQRFGISAKTLDGIHRQLKARLSSIAELAKLRAAEIQVRIVAKRRQIVKIEKALRRKRPPNAVQRDRLRFALHQHKRRLAILEHRLKDAPGRPVMTRRIKLVTYGKTRAQRLDMIRKAAAEVAKLAISLGVPVVAENLDFGRKRAELETVVGKKRARMLSSFAYTAFADALARVCVRRSVRLVLVNPAYTSLIGRVKFAPRYGSSVHAAAALAIARRAMALSERLPASGETISVVLASGDRVTLPRPARIARRHVWSSWSRLSAGLSAVHAGRSGGASLDAIGRRERS